MKLLLSLTVPLIMSFVFICAAIKGVELFPALTSGAAEGLKTVAEMLPALIVLFPAVYMLRASGAIDALAGFLSPVLSFLGIPPETVGLALLRPVSGAAATAVASDIIHTSGADSLIGRTAAVMMGSSETTLYVIAVYFGAAGIKDTRWAVPAALCADAVAFLSAAWVCRAMY